MKTTILIDNNTLREDLIPEKGFSALIETEDKNILYDTGKDGNLISNAEKLGIDLLTVDVIAISHGHHDHMNGLEALITFFQENNDSKKRPLIIHPKAFIDRWNSKDERYIGSALKKEDLEDYFDLQLSYEPVSITDKLIWMGEIKRTNDFECQNLETHTESGKDKIEDDTALVYRSDTGLVVISGCSHSGICNIIEHAKIIGENKKIVDVIGGIHLKNARDDLIQQTISGVENNAPEAVHFCHCTGASAFKYLKESSGLNFYPIGCGWHKIYP